MKAAVTSSRFHPCQDRGVGQSRKRSFHVLLAMPESLWIAFRRSGHLASRREWSRSARRQGYRGGLVSPMDTPTASDGCLFRGGHRERLVLSDLVVAGREDRVLKDPKSKDFDEQGDDPAYQPIGFRAIAAALSVRRPSASSRKDIEVPPAGSVLPSGFHSPPDD